MALELRPSCEHCNKALPPTTTDARICSFECTFCAACADPAIAAMEGQRLPGRASRQHDSEAPAR